MEKDLNKSAIVRCPECGSPNTASVSSGFKSEKDQSSHSYREDYHQCIDCENIFRVDLED